MDKEIKEFEKKYRDSAVKENRDKLPLFYTRLELRIILSDYKKKHGIK